MSRRLQIMLGIVIVAVIAGAIGAFFWNKNSGSINRANNDRNTNAESPKVVRSDAPQNQMIKGFPTALAFVKDAKIIESYSIDQGVKTLVTKFRTGASVNDVYAAYSKYFTENQYTIQYKTEPDKGPVAALYAVKGSEMVNITISSAFGAESTEVNIGYTNTSAQ